MTTARLPLTTNQLMEEISVLLHDKNILEADRFNEVCQYLTKKREENACDYFAGCKDPAETIWHAILTNNVNTLNLSTLIMAHDSVNADYSKLYDYKTKSSSIDPDEIIEIIKMMIETIMMIIQYFETADVCKQKQNIQKLEETLSKMNGNPFTNLAKAYLKDLNLQGLNLSHINLEQATLSHVTLTNSNLRHANLKYVLTRGYVNLTGSQLAGANLDWADLSKAVIDKEQFSHLDLNGHLKTLFPITIKYSGPLPSSVEVKPLLTHYDESLRTDKAHASAPIEKRAHAHHIIATNLSRIASNPAENQLQEAHDMLKEAYNDPLFANHNSARMMGNINKALVSTHNFFSHHHVKDTPIVGNYSQNILLKTLNNIEKKMPKHSVKPH